MKLVSHPLSAVRFTAPSQRTGGVVVLMAFLLPVLLILTAFSINIAYMELTRTELQIATDAACRAAGRELAFSGNADEAVRVASEVANRNTVAGVPFQIAGSDFVFGYSSRSGVYERYAFQPNVMPFNSLRLRSDSHFGNLGLRMPIGIGCEGVDFRPVQLATCAQVELDVCLVVDRSGSMAYGSDEIADPLRNPSRAPLGWTFGQAVPPLSRWSEAQTAVDAFFEVLNNSPQQEQVSLATYNHNTFSEIPLTTDYQPIVDRLQAYSMAFEAGGTNIGGGIVEGITVLANSPNKRPWAVKAAIVLTDGIHNWGTSPMDGATQASSQNLTLYTVTFSNEADQVLMQQVAQEGAGRHFHARNRDELVAAFQTIARSLPLLLTE